MIDIGLVVDPHQVESVRNLFREYAASLDVDLEYQNFPAELAGLPGSYSPPGGSLLLAHDGDAAVGCVAFRRMDERVCEMKRLYVRPVSQGRGVGALLVAAAIERARALGYGQMWLDTLPSMAGAQRLYARLGFDPIAPYGPPSAPGTRFFGLRLVP